jgi:hypothetical protein
MKDVFWNIRGLNKPDRGKCIADMMRINSVDFIGVQETKKEGIPKGFVNSIDRNFTWKYVLLGAFLWV